MWVVPDEMFFNYKAVGKSFVRWDTHDNRGWGRSAEKAHVGLSI
jgi:hypothetical protein